MMFLYFFMCFSSSIFFLVCHYISFIFHVLCANNVVTFSMGYSGQCGICSCYVYCCSSVWQYLLGDTGYTFSGVVGSCLLFWWVVCLSSVACVFIFCVSFFFLLLFIFWWCVYPLIFILATSINPSSRFSFMQ